MLDKHVKSFGLNPLKYITHMHNLLDQNPLIVPLYATGSNATFYMIFYGLVG
jgi:hypothetical protein